MMDLKKLSDKELLNLENHLENEVTKYDLLQLTKKIQLNSAYGVCGNQYFRFYETRLAESITKTGQLIIKVIERAINNYLNRILKTEEKDYVIAMDTDSCYLDLNDVVSKLPKDTPREKIVKAMDKLCIEKIRPEIDKAITELSDYTNCFVNRMNMKREVIADRGFWTRKKRYCLNIWSEKEGVILKEPKQKIMGLEAVRSTTPEIVRDKMKQCIKLILTSDNKAVIDFIDMSKKDFKTLKPEDIAFPTTVNNLVKYSSSLTIYGKGSPIHVKGALIYNDLIKKGKLETKYRTIFEGDKISYLYLMEPNPLHIPSIAFIDELPEEFGVREYVDYDKQFQKSFYEPMKRILEVCGWSTEEVFTIDQFFGE